MNKNILLNVKILILSLIFAQILFAAQGDLDTTFNPAGTPPGTVVTIIGDDATSQAVALQSDGKIVVAGRTFIAGSFRFALLRYNTNGSLDNTFGSNGIVTTAVGSNSNITGVAIQSDGKIVVSGVSDGKFAIARYNTNGTLDTSFNSSGIVTTSIGSGSGARSIIIQPDGKIVVAGFAVLSGSEFALARYNTDGTLDTSFNSSGIVTTAIGTNDSAAALAIQTDGKIVAAGYSNNKFALARYNTDGTLDTTFNLSGTLTTAIGSSAQAFGVAIQSDGKIVAAGRATVGAVTQFALARYNNVGALDAAFNSSGTVTTEIGSNSQSFGVSIQSDGKIVAAGLSDSSFAVARYNKDATLDSTFNSSGILPGTVTTSINLSSNGFAITIQSDGKIVVAGTSVDIDEVGSFAVARYLASSTLIQSVLTTAIKNKYCGNGA